MPPTPPFSFRVTCTDGAARAGVMTTPHGAVETPMFMPVGTQGAVKAMTVRGLQDAGARIILGNTYHLWLRPGAELIARRGGLHRFNGWPGPILTDSGGYQVFSLAERRKVEETGVYFRSHLDGSAMLLTPERAVEIQALLGSDIAMVLDECPPGDGDRGTVERAIERTTRWAHHCLASPRAEGQSRFGIVQGGSFLDLRLAHLAELAELPFEGLALGGFSVGEPIEIMYGLLSELAPHLPAHKPHYLMGVGKPVDLLRAIAAGIDMFDCVLPTRNARNGQALTWGGRVNLRQSRHQRADQPLDARCDCPVCTTYSRAYLRHLFLAKEILGPRLITQHNLHFYQSLMRGARQAIADRRYAAYARETEAGFIEGDEVATPS